MPGIQERHLAPMTRGLDLGVDFGHGVDRSPKPLQSLRAPTAKRLHGERNEPSSW